LRLIRSFETALGQLEELMDLFITSVAVVLIVSALCSLSEAALYAVAPAYVRQLAESSSPQGKILTRFKENMGPPITAILILNTVANTAGAAVAGAQARLLFGEAALLWFAAAFTLAVLVLSEVIPKVIGVSRNRAVSRMIAVPLNGIVRVLWPFVWLTRRFSDAIASGREPLAPESEVHRIADLSAEEGSILPSEAALVKNVLRMDEIKARDIMTPRTVVFKESDDLTVKEISKDAWALPHARIPIHDANDSDNWTGLVLRRDILACLGRDQFDVTLKSLAKPLGFVPETLPGNELLNLIIRGRKHLFGVIDEYGNIIGIVTLEDVLESLIGEEIVDETDKVVDMREVARKRSVQQYGDALPQGENGADKGESQ
jgi:CBS domain containing-hemolysin-like protein